MPHCPHSQLSIFQIPWQPSAPACPRCPTPALLFNVFLPLSQPLPRLLWHFIIRPFHCFKPAPLSAALVLLRLFILTLFPSSPSSPSPPSLFFKNPAVVSACPAHIKLHHSTINNGKDCSGFFFLIRLSGGVWGMWNLAVLKGVTWWYITSRVVADDMLLPSSCSSDLLSAVQWLPCCSCILQVI